MFTKASSLLLLCSYAFTSFSQPGTWIQGARTGALANADAALQDTWNTAGNPAGTAIFSSPSLSFALERRFLLKELDTRAVSALVPFKKQVFGLNINFFGSSLYNEHLVSLSYARALSAGFRAGLRFNYHGIKIPDYTSQQAVSVAAGIQASPWTGLTLGAYISNPNKAAFEDVLEADIPVTAALGAAYAFSGKVLAVTELEKVSGYPAVLRAGLEYAFHASLRARAGVSTSPFRQYAGLGLCYSGFALDVAASAHQQLGFTPQIAISYEF
ncbi:MAG TPA: hypothetical protein VD772_05985 [Anseongella sp.]|nr:hypothetical protein [Anseongella sp.]